VPDRAFLDSEIYCSGFFLKFSKKYKADPFSLQDTLELKMSKNIFLVKIKSIQQFFLDGFYTLVSVATKKNKKYDIYDT
jgi:hypothetical protein